MGRGRAKAKQTKVARQLKYQTLNTDFDALQRELGSDGSTAAAVEPDDYDADEYGAYDDSDEDEESRRSVG
ncbi:MAG TPA: DUF3073 domain-containing protein [Jiangellaceae bacterium]|nr:DUF3073 domain-containing protein [Jiangellaceae bacterium]